MMLMLLMQLVGQSSISCTSDPSMPTPSRHLIEVAVDSGSVEVTGWDGLGSLPKPGQSESDEARLLYVAMTRATERLLLIHHDDSVFSKRIRDSINEVQAQLAPPG